MNIQTRGNSFENLKNNKIRQNQVKSFDTGQILKKNVFWYYQDKNWIGLLNYLLMLENRNKLPLSWKWQVGQAYVNNNECQLSLDFLHNLHFLNPRQAEVHLTILQALFALRKDDNSFHWIYQPPVQAVDREILRNCYLIISARQNSIPLFILYSLVKNNEKISFSEFDLLFALLRDSRFYIFNDTCFYRFSRIDLKAESLQRAA